VTAQRPFKRTYEPNPEPEPRTESVTRPQLPTEPPKTYQCLLAGVDSLDLGIYVDWGEDWDRRFGEFEELKQRASDNGRKEPVLIECPGIDPFIVHANGKPPMYRFRLQTSDGQIWIGKSRTPENNTPNVFVSLNSEPIWRDGLETVIARLQTGIAALGAKVLTVQPSRADLCADFYVPDGFNLYELVEQTVCDSGERDVRMNDDQVATYYVGSNSGNIKLRLYDKSREIRKHPDRSFFLEFWNVPEESEVWRVEFECRRPFLKDFSVDSAESLFSTRGSLWAFLARWVTLRTGDDTNKSRRPLSPFWEAVQKAGEHFQGNQPLKKREKDAPCPQEEWYLARIRNYVETLAALWKFTDPVKTMRTILSRMRKDWHGDLFAERVMLKAIDKGWPLPEEGGGDEPAED
jgi:hypothetical protein